MGSSTPKCLVLFDFLGTLMESAQLLPGVESLLNALSSEGAMIGVITRTKTIEAREQLSKAGVSKYFSFVIGSANDTWKAFETAAKTADFEANVEFVRKENTFLVDDNAQRARVASQGMVSSFIFVGTGDSRFNIKELTESVSFLPRESYQIFPNLSETQKVVEFIKGRLANAEKSPKSRSIA